MKSTTRTLALPMLAASALALSGCMANYYTREDGRKMSDSEWAKVCARLNKVVNGGRPGASPFLRDSINESLDSSYQNAVYSLSNLECDKPYAVTERGMLAASRKEAWERTKSAEADYRRRMSLLSASAQRHYPPTSFQSCKAMQGQWYAECARMEGGRCVEASHVKGACTGYVHPGIEDSSACEARGGQFRPACAVWKVDEQPKPPRHKLTCAKPATYGTCHDPFVRRSDLYSVSLPFGRIIQPRTGGEK